MPLEQLSKTENENKDQYALDFDSPLAERKARMNHALSKVGAKPNITLFCWWIFNITAAGGGRATFKKSYTQIGHEFGVSRPTARRWANTAVSLGLIVVETSRYCTGGQAAHEYSLDWESIRELTTEHDRVKTKPEKQTEKPPEKLDGPTRNRGIIFDPTPYQKRPYPVPKMTLPRTKIDTPYKEYNSFNNSFNNSPPPKKQSKSNENERRDPWPEVEGELLKMGLTSASRAVAHAKRNQLTPDEVRALILFFRSKPGAWSLSGLCWRIENGQPGVAAAEAWPKVAGTYADATEKAAQAKRKRSSNNAISKRLSEFQATKNKIELERQQSAKLDLAYGPELDGMPLFELDKLAEKVCSPMMQNQYRRQRAEKQKPSGLVRLALIDHLAGVN